ncbi:LysR substrate-binding domain-containing protein [Pantoea sp. B65]|uniref:LysR substrate-binding domain-containing protein n=1 Tax=Pantoea sp. B65 TaxID=2813359 RepID=UPI0039B6D5C5
MMKSAKLPRLNAIVAFKTAAETGSLAKAATQLALTPAAVSQQIRQLEQQLGVLVFTRSQSGVQLTTAGRDYLRYVIEAFDILQLAQQHLQAAPQQNQLTLVSLPALASKWLTPHLGEWLRQHPAINIAVQATHARVDFTSSPADFVLCFGDHHYPQLQQLPLFQDQVLPVCSPQLLAAAPESFNPLAYPLIHLDWGNDGRYLPGWSDWLQMAGITADRPLNGLTFNLTSLAIEAAVQGNGLLLGQRMLIQQELRQGTLVVPDSRALPLSKPYYLAWPERTLAKPGAQAMIGWLQQLAQH